MVKLLRPGRVVIMLAGRYAGKKAVVVSVSEQGNADRPFGHAVVAGVAAPPRKVHKRMSKKKIEQRVKVRSFIKTVNFNHMMPTRYVVTSDFDFKTILDERAQLKEMKKKISDAFLDKFLDPINAKTNKPSKDVLFLRSKLRF